jgi:hypothetical protein
MTQTGEARPVKWIGKRSYSGRFVMGRRDILPVCFKAGSLDENVPRRDLWISPHHAMYLDGVLIEAKDLVNGISIVQAEHVEKVEYFHIELDSHDVLLAEGAWSESFIDDDSRAMFHNAHEYRKLYAEEPIEPARYCAPRLEDGFEIETVRHKIARRAGLKTAAMKPCGRLRGHIDQVTWHVVEGWAQDETYPEVPVCLDILIDGRVISQVLANSYRKDLAEAGLGSGCHAFRFEMPDTIRKTKFVPMVRVRRSSDGSDLQKSDLAMSFAAA